MTDKKCILTCDRPDRDVPGIICGYPLPCPWHTAVVHVGRTRTTVKVPASIGDAVTTARINALGAAVAGGRASASVKAKDPKCLQCSKRHTGGACPTTKRRKR